MVAVRTALIVVRIHDTRAGEAFIGAELGFFEDARAAQRCLTRNPESDNAMRAQVLAMRLATLAMFTWYEWHWHDADLIAKAITRGETVAPHLT